MLAGWVGVPDAGAPWPQARLRASSAKATKWVRRAEVFMTSSFTVMNNLANHRLKVNRLWFTRIKEWHPEQAVFEPVILEHSWERW
jgi:hypothetical protein